MFRSPIDILILTGLTAACRSLPFGSTPTPTQTILAAESIFKRLLAEATPAGQLYALAALHVINPEFARRTAKRYESSQEVVQTQFGCINAEMPTAEVTTQILEGTLPRALAGNE